MSELTIEWARTGQLCSGIRTELEQQLTRHAPHAPSSEQAVP
ncbi:MULTISPECIES: hypothetical protein [unclassified Streptomyces]|nr:MULTISPECIES: hypothetical protein [unclassified Streptomyces]